MTRLPFGSALYGSTYKDYTIDYTPMARFALTIQRVIRGMFGRRRYRHAFLNQNIGGTTLIDTLLQRLRLALGTEPLGDDDNDWD